MCENECDAIIYVTTHNFLLLLVQESNDKREKRKYQKRGKKVSKERKESIKREEEKYQKRKESIKDRKRSIKRSFF